MLEKAATDHLWCTSVAQVTRGDSAPGFNRLGLSACFRSRLCHLGNINGVFMFNLFPVRTGIGVQAGVVSP